MRGGGTSGNTVKRGNFLQVYMAVMDVGNNKNHVLAGLDFKKPFLAHFNHISLVPGKRLIHI